MTSTELTLEQLQAVAGGVIYSNFLTGAASRGVIHPTFCEAPERVARLSYAEAVGLDSSTVDVVNNVTGSAGPGCDDV